MLVSYWVLNPALFWTVFDPWSKRWITLMTHSYKHPVMCSFSWRTCSGNSASAVLSICIGAPLKSLVSYWICRCWCRCSWSCGCCWHWPCARGCRCRCRRTRCAACGCAAGQRRPCCGPASVDAIVRLAAGPAHSFACNERLFEWVMPNIRLFNTLPLLSL